jgi:hypothetical protein
MDAQAAAELRDAKRAAARTLAEHGVHAQVVVDANECPSSPPPGQGSAGEPPASGATPGPGPAPGPEVRRYGLPRGKGEASYVKLRLARFRARLEESRKR